MVKAVPIPPPGFDELSMEEKLDYVQSLLDPLLPTPEKIPVPDWHKQTVTERVADYQANPDEGQTWDQVRNELEQKILKKPSH